MGILNDVGGAAQGSLDNFLDSLPNPFKTKKVPKRFAPDFLEGFIITEFENGVEKSNADNFGLVLKGHQLPFQPFPFGGEQKIVKDYYAGNPEPVVQVLGPRESEVVIKGRLKAKAFSNKLEDKDAAGSMYRVPIAIQEQMDAIRLRGNLLRLNLGEWERFAFLEKTHFELNQVSRIDYELTFTIIGFNKPTNCKFTDRTKLIPFDDNKALIAAANAFITKGPPDNMPKSLSLLLGKAMSDVFGAVSLVTNFVDTTVRSAEDVVSTVNRVKGVILNARATISKFKRSVRGIQLSIESLGSTFTNKNGGLGTNVRTVLGVDNNLPTSQKKSLLTTSTYSNTAYINSAVSQTKVLSQILATMHSRFDQLSKSTPLLRYSVKTGDTLQKLSIKYYGVADSWNKIYDHNKLSTTVLVVGSILEIPRL
jgi:LysM repeat protein